ncbi:MAG: DUF4097 family beta strand repeat protein [Ignavibacteriaceae bacterium]|nr:DUF4097 family beta strand repeat protein [Ignavibacteriaceae bacterium]
MKLLFLSRLKLSAVYVLILLSSFAYSCTDIDNVDENLKIIHEKTFTILPGKDLHLDASLGNINVTSWSKNEVHIKILGNAKAKEKVEFLFNESEDKIEIQAKYDWSLFMSLKNVKLIFEIQVPREFNLKTITAGGDIKIQDVKGKIYSRTSGGDIILSQVNGKTDIGTSGGDISFNNSYGDINASTSGGNIKGNKFSGKIEVSTSGGDIELIGSDSRIFGTTSGGDITLDYSGQNHGIELETSGGDINVSMPKDINAQAHFSTSGGSIKSEFKGNNAIEISSSKFEAEINDGGNAIVLKTSGGDITVRKK